VTLGKAFAECLIVGHQIETAGRSAPVGQTIRACAEHIRVPSFVLRLLAKFAELARAISL
jgi:hypothetical protein